MIHEATDTVIPPYSTNLPLHFVCPHKTSNCPYNTCLLCPHNRGTTVLVSRNFII